MVSFNTPLSPTRRKMIQEFEDSSKKRKWEESQGEDISASKAKITKSIFDTELNLETPLPLEWQRCLDIKSGQIYYYNTSTNKETSRDPRRSPEPELPSPKHMSLDLELNLPCGSSVVKNTKCNNSTTGSQRNIGGGSGGGGGGGDGLLRSPSWLAFEGDHQQEMVAAVCKKCHMLVMMFKSSPACPNCKFMHPPDQSPPRLFDRGLSLLC